MNTSQNTNHQRLAVVGKGGVGKSALTALMARAFIRMGTFYPLVIDADPTMGLCNVMGVRAEKTLEDIRHEIISVAGRGDQQDREDFVAQLDYRLFEALVEEKEFALLAMGQPQQSGCFCPANTLLKQAIESLSIQFERVLIDCEAGLEQISRKVMGNIDTLIIVSDPTRRGVQTAQAIEKAASRFIRPQTTLLIMNRVKAGIHQLSDLTKGTGLRVIGSIPEDEKISEWDFTGRPIIHLPDDCPSVIALHEIMRTLIEEGPEP